MLSIAPAFQTSLALPALSDVWLYEAAFTVGTLRLNTWGVDRDFDGFTWLGRGQLVEVSATTESEDGGRQRFALTLAGVLQSNIGLAIGDPAVYRGREIRMYRCLLSPQGAQLAPAQLRVLGFMDKVSIQADAEEGGEVMKVVMECYANMRGTLIDASAFRVNNTTHQSQYPGELGLEYQADLIVKPQTWLTKRFQQV